MPVIGIDLAGKEKNDTGICIYFLKQLGDEEQKIVTFTMHTDGEILRVISRFKPVVVAIDAPLSLPEEGEGAFRTCDRMLIQRGYRVLPPVFRGMRILVERAMRLKETIEKGHSIKIIETFPRAVQEIYGIEKQKGVSEHEFDAFLCALAAKAYVEGKYEDLQGIILPK